MAKENLEFLLSKIESIILHKGFKREGKQQSYVRKFKTDYNRQEKISFYARQHREDKNAIFITGAIGIYYPSVTKNYKTLIKDHLSGYPIVGGNMGNFIPNGKYMDIYYKKENDDYIAQHELIRNLEEGAFYLLKTFPNLESIYGGIINQHPLLQDFYRNVDYSTNILIVSIIFTLYGKEKASLWAKENLEVDKSESIVKNLLSIYTANSHKSSKRL